MKDKKKKKIKPVQKVKPKKVKKIEPKKAKKIQPKKQIHKEKKKAKISFKKVLIFILICYLVVSIVMSVMNFKIKNIVVVNNNLLTDQEIIEMAKISNYPSFFQTFSSTIEKRLLKNDYIKDVKVTKKISGEIRIEVLENYPLFYNTSSSKTVLLDGTSIKKKGESAVLINYVPDNIYPIFLKKMQTISPDVLARTSEIQYTPNEVDDSRFMFYMTDGNYVYLTLSKFENINDYVNIMENIIAKFGNQNGILNLDSGGYFDLLE